MLFFYFFLFIDAIIATVLINRFYRWPSSTPSDQKFKRHKALNITFLHPDLGIGGAERLVLDAMLACKNSGHKPRIVTNFFDPKRCFPDALEMSVSVAGDWCPRHINGRGHVLFASIRMFLAAIYCSFFLTDTDVFVVDQVSLAMVPLRLLTPKNILFYCHFPDQLCDPTRMKGNANEIKDRSLVRRVYRTVFDTVEASTMSFASRIVCNSNFTLGVTLDTFPSLKKSPALITSSNKQDDDDNKDQKTSSSSAVLYPPVAVSGLLNQPIDTDSSLAKLANSFTIVSINRYERKKNLPLAIEAFAEFKNNSGLFEKDADGKKPVYDTKLVLAGGYDDRLPENVEHFKELNELAKKLGVADDVTFLRSISDGTKRQLLRQVASAIVYTPTNEHFGIVPVEAMACQKPVVAVNLGGPLESVGTDKTCGLLTDAEPKKFAAAFAELYEMGVEKRKKMGKKGADRVNDLFTIQAFSLKLCEILEGLA